MKEFPSNEQALQQQLEELQLVCRIWIAASQAKDERIAELEREVAQLSRRVARLARHAGRQSSGGLRRRASNHG